MISPDVMNFSNETSLGPGYGKKMKFLLHLLGLISQFFVSTVQPTTDVANICGPDTDSGLAQRLTTSQWQASQWLLDQQTQAWGWDFLGTGSAILSLHLANETWTNQPRTLEAQLTVKQLNIEVLRALSHKHHLRDMPIGELAYYVMALEATCHDVTNFHGHNLVHVLQRRVHSFHANRTGDAFSFSLAVLALCSTGGEISDRAVEVLQEAQYDNGCFHFGIDVTSMAVMAMSCMLQSTNDATSLDTLETMIEAGTQCILGYRNNEGGFGNDDRTNVISTALAAQAFIAAGKAPSLWGCADTLTILLDAQDNQGHFGSQAGTIQIIPLLSNRHHGSLMDMERECPGDLLEVVPMIGNEDETITVQIEISQTVGGSLGVFEPFSVEALPGESLFRVMERARQIGHLSFNSRMTQFGNYITAINNIEIDTVDNLYWFLYEVQESGEQTSSPTGAEHTFPEDGGHYHWIYRAYVVPH